MSLDHPKFRHQGAQLGTDDPLGLVGPVAAILQGQFKQQCADSSDDGVVFRVGEDPEEGFPEGGEVLKAGRIDDGRDGNGVRCRLGGGQAWD